MKIEEVFQELKFGEQLVYNKSLSWVAIVYLDGDTNKTHRVFKVKDNELEEIPYKEVKKQLTEIMMKKIDHDKLVQLILNESIDTTDPTELFDLIERVVDKNGNVTQRKGCVELEVTGKPGRHMHFRLM